MISFEKYARISFAATTAVIYHALNIKVQYDLAMVYLSSSTINIAVLLNMRLVIMCMLWKLVKCLFLGTLREQEVESLNELAWRELVGMFFTVTIFRYDLSVTSVVMVTVLLLIKSLHCLALKRFEYIKTTPNMNFLSHIRIVSFMLFILVVDCLFLHNSLKSVIQTWQAPALYFSFEYTILGSTTTATLMKYVFYVMDMLMEGQWERKPTFMFYLELIHDLVNLSLHIISFLVILMHYGVPLHSIRHLVETFQNFRNRIVDGIRYRKVTSSMEERFPDATPEELNPGNETCIICREEMVTAKKLLCGHLFHAHCLLSWLERHNTCPTCRALIVLPETGQARSHRQCENALDHQAGTSEGSEDRAREDYLKQARGRAAAVAASVDAPLGYETNASGSSMETHTEVLHSELQPLQQQNADQTRMGSENIDVVESDAKVEDVVTAGSGYAPSTSLAYRRWRCGETQGVGSSQYHDQG